MSLELRINDAIKTAMKSKDAVSLRGLRAIKSAILLAKTDGSGKELDETGEIKIVQKISKATKRFFGHFRKTKSRRFGG